MSKENNHSCQCGHDHEHHHHDDGHECGCGCHSHEGAEVLYLSLNDGKELECQVLGIFEIKDKEYIALLPKDGEDVFLYGFEETEEGPVLSQIETDEEYEMVSEAFLSLCE
ncbi:DUF1292 domain-containing protein [Wukongibacter baidiensis]|uniref:DUF1292 domain-containing protein n=1 Tax=Wukongibacter baidiensis TaxID=1723361 RepID=UPI003D7F3F90